MVKNNLVRTKEEEEGIGGDSKVNGHFLLSDILKNVLSSICLHNKINS